MIYDAYTKKNRLPNIKEIEAYTKLAPDEPVVPVASGVKHGQPWNGYGVTPNFYPSQVTPVTIPPLPSNNGIGYGADSVGGGVTPAANPQGTPTPDTPTPQPTLGTNSAYDSLITEAEGVRDDTIAQAEKTRETAISDAQRAYGQMLSESAQNAEKLARMGLTNSGYSDYLDASAYATKRGEISKAQATYDTNVQNAYSAYEQSVSDANTKRNDSYLALLQSLDSGEISASVAQEVAKAYGYTPEQIKTIEDKITKDQQGNLADYETYIQSGNGVSATQLNADVIAGNISQEGAVKVMTDYFDTATKSGDPTVYEPMLKEFDKAHAEGMIDLNTYQNKYNEFARSLYNAAATIEGDRTTKYNNAMNAAKDIEEFYKAGKITKPVYDSLKNSITTFANSVGAMVGTEGQYALIGKNLASYEGVHVVIDGNQYRVIPREEYNRNSTMAKTLNEVAERENGHSKDGSVVIYQGVYYHKNGNKWHSSDVQNDKIADILGEIAGDQTPKDGTVVSYQGTYFVRHNSAWRQLTPSNNTSNNNGNTLR